MPVSKKRKKTKKNPIVRKLYPDSISVDKCKLTTNELGRLVNVINTMSILIDSGFDANKIMQHLSYEDQEAYSLLPVAAYLFNSGKITFTIVLEKDIQYVKDTIGLDVTEECSVIESNGVLDITAGERESILTRLALKNAWENKAVYFT